MFDDLSTHNYEEFLNHFLESDYALVSFAGSKTRKDPDRPYAVIRHDIDFDCELALQIAQLENRLSVKSTFFFLISSESYNVASSRNRTYIEQIRDLGHEISIHFDPVVYTDFIKGFQCERLFFESLFDVSIEVISLHRPTPYFLEYDQPICDVEHTYQSKYFEKLKYFSDSTGVWRYGHPANSTEFTERKNLHILIHPIWWLVSDDETNNQDKIKRHYLQRVEQVKKHYAENCKPFLDIYDTV
jgi:hypothetical protein